MDERRDEQPPPSALTRGKETAVKDGRRDLAGTAGTATRSGRFAEHVVDGFERLALHELGPLAQEGGDAGLDFGVDGPVGQGRRVPGHPLPRQVRTR